MSVFIDKIRNCLMAPTVVRMALTFALERPSRGLVRAKNNTIKNYDLANREDSMCSHNQLRPRPNFVLLHY